MANQLHTASIRRHTDHDQISEDIHEILVPSGSQSEENLQSYDSSTTRHAIAKVLSLRAALSFRAHHAVKAALHAHVIGAQCAEVISRPEKVRYRVCHAVTIGTKTFLARVENDGNIRINMETFRNLMECSSVRLGKASIRQHASLAIVDGLDGMILGVNLKELHAKGGLNWWICQDDGYTFNPHIPLDAFNASQVFTIAAEFGIPVVPLTEQTLAYEKGWNEHHLDTGLPIQGEIAARIPPMVIQCQHEAPETRYFFIGRAFDSLCAWVKRYPKIIGARKIRLSHLSDWMSAVTQINSHASCDTTEVQS